MLSYPVRLVPTEGRRVKAMFPDVPEAVAEGANEEEALHQAGFCLELSLANYIRQGRSIPQPSDICGAPTVSTAKFAL